VIEMMRKSLDIELVVSISTQGLRSTTRKTSSKRIKSEKHTSRPSYLLGVTRALTCDPNVG
jgi:hypothetical protein